MLNELSLALKKLGFKKCNNKANRVNNFEKIIKDKFVYFVTISNFRNNIVSITIGLRIEMVESYMEEYEVSEMTKMDFLNLDVLRRPTLFKIIYEGSLSEFSLNIFLNTIGKYDSILEASSIEKYMDNIRTYTLPDDFPDGGSIYLLKRTMVSWFIEDIFQDFTLENILKKDMNVKAYEKDIRRFKDWLLIRFA